MKLAELINEDVKRKLTAKPPTIAQLNAGVKYWHDKFTRCPTCNKEILNNTPCSCKPITHRTVILRKEK